MSIYPNASVKSIESIISSKLAIPPYQRAYVWTEDNTRQLLDDIYKNIDNDSYQIGSLILHDNGNYDIIDGQQRITTILLILKVLGEQSPLLESINYGHVESRYHIYKNYKYISEYFENKDKDKFKKYLLENCSMVQVVVDDISEAFQMFDSQNSRGKPLEPHDLLKAFHMKAMNEEITDIKIKHDKEWQKASDSSLLSRVLGEHLYRIRLWSKKNYAGEFKKQQIKEFKGYTLRCGKVSHPYQNYLLHLVLSPKINFDIKNRFDDNDIPQNINPYVNINQKIINGKTYFEYVETYVEIFRQVFQNIQKNENKQPLAEFKDFYHKYTLSYAGSRRTGDIYLRHLYESLIIMMLDKFGEKAVKDYYKILYRIVYLLRLQYGAVRYTTIAKPDTTHDLFHIIEHSYETREMNQLEQILSENKKMSTPKFTNIPDEIKNMILEGEGK